MFVTTKAEYIWDSSSNKYIEVYTEGYEYSGEVAFLQSSMEDLMRSMGYDEENIEKYAGFAPSYEQWQEKYLEEEYGYAGEEYDIAGEQYRMAGERDVFATARRGEAREAAGKELGFAYQTMGQQMTGTLASSQTQAYDIFAQGEQVAAGGLGARKGLTQRGMQTLEAGTETALGGQAMTGLRAEAAYEGTLSDVAASAFGAAQQYETAGLQYDLADIGFRRAGSEYRSGYEELYRDYEQSMYDYLLMLGQEFDIWGEGQGEEGYGADYQPGGGVPEYDSIPQNYTGNDIVRVNGVNYFWNEETGTYGTSFKGSTGG